MRASVLVAPLLLAVLLLGGLAPSAQTVQRLPGMDLKVAGLAWAAVPLEGARGGALAVDWAGRAYVLYLLEPGGVCAYAVLGYDASTGEELWRRILDLGRGPGCSLTSMVQLKPSYDGLLAVAGIVEYGGPIGGARVLHIAVLDSGTGDVVARWSIDAGLVHRFSMEWLRGLLVVGLGGEVLAYSVDGGLEWRLGLEDIFGDTQAGGPVRVTSCGFNIVAMAPLAGMAGIGPGGAVAWVSGEVSVIDPYNTLVLCEDMMLTIVEGGRAWRVFGDFGGVFQEYNLPMEGMPAAMAILDPVTVMAYGRDELVFYTLTQPEVHYKSRGNDLPLGEPIIVPGGGKAAVLGKSDNGTVLQVFRKDVLEYVRTVDWDVLAPGSSYPVAGAWINDTLLVLLNYKEDGWRSGLAALTFERPVMVVLKASGTEGTVRVTAPDRGISYTVPLPRGLLSVAIPLMAGPLEVLVTLSSFEEDLDHVGPVGEYLKEASIGYSGLNPGPGSVYTINLAQDFMAYLIPVAFKLPGPLLAEVTLEYLGPVEADNRTWTIIVDGRGEPRPLLAVPGEYRAIVRVDPGAMDGRVAGHPPAPVEAIIEIRSPGFIELPVGLARLTVVGPGVVEVKPVPSGKEALLAPPPGGEETVWLGPGEYRLILKYRLGTKLVGPGGLAGEEVETLVLEPGQEVTFNMSERLQSRLASVTVENPNSMEAEAIFTYNYTMDGETFLGQEAITLPPGGSETVYLVPGVRYTVSVVYKDLEAGPGVEELVVSMVDVDEVTPEPGGVYHITLPPPPSEEPSQATGTATIVAGTPGPGEQVAGGDEGGQEEALEEPGEAQPGAQDSGEPGGPGGGIPVLIVAVIILVALAGIVLARRRA